MQSLEGESGVPGNVTRRPLALPRPGPGLLAAGPGSVEDGDVGLVVEGDPRPQDHHQAASITQLTSSSLCSSGPSCAQLACHMKAIFTVCSIHGGWPPSMHVHECLHHWLGRCDQVER